MKQLILFKALKETRKQIEMDEINFQLARDLAHKALEYIKLEGFDCGALDFARKLYIINSKL